MPAHPGPHHHSARPLSPREQAALVDLESRLAATRSWRFSIAEHVGRAVATLAAAVVVVAVLVGAGALLGPAGIALGTTALVTILLGMVLRDLMTSGMARGPVSGSR
jgi:hypothetical protein